MSECTTLRAGADMGLSWAGGPARRVSDARGRVNGTGDAPVLFVMAGLVPAIPLRRAPCLHKRGRGVKPGDDEESHAGRCARRNERICRTASGTRSFGSMKGKKLASALGA